MVLAARTWLLLASVAFSLTAVAGAMLVYVEPAPESAGSVALALAFSLACLHLATRPRGPRAGCSRCGAAQDLGLTFCARCGA